MKRQVRSFLAVITILVLCLPTGFIITVVLYPFWLWIENTFDLESVGHSGPSDWCFWVVYLICVTLALVCFLQFGTQKILSVLAALFGIIFLVLLFLPLPHGGSIGAALFHELTDVIGEMPEKKIEAEKRKAEYDSKREKLYHKLSGRFTGPLEFKQDFYTDHWQIGTVLGRKAWLDTKTGIIWGSEIYSGLSDWGGEGLQSAIGYCRDIEPQGFWSLPTNAEFALGIKSRMQDYIDNLTGKWIAQSYSSGLSGLTPMPSLVGFSNQGINEISVRCVGRTDKAPLHGYIRDDITNADVLGMISR